ncbi:MAG: hypothetical protein F4Y40_07220 [Acidimicrobiia bacterium]|nr:hypothetical protein [Acidimicrobiia bacterium]MYF84040.1 hypothetical protein [Acidimicrobiia bacterium]
MATATEGYVEAQTGRLKAEMQAQVIEAIQQSDRARFRETMWLAALMLASVASAAGLVIAVLR